MKTIIAGIAILLCCTAARAQEHSPRTSEGDRALLFSINGFGNFGVGGTLAGGVGSSTAARDSSPGLGTAVPIYGIGAKYFIAPRTAVRAALGFGSSSTTLPGTNGSGGGSSSSVSTFGFTPAIEFHLVQSGSITGYVGGFASYARASSGSGGEESDYSNSATSISAGTLLGVEFFPWNGLSFGAEYQLGVRSTYSSTTLQGNSTDGPSASDVGIGTVAVRLAVYL